MDTFEIRLLRALREILEARAAELTKLLVLTPASDHSSYMSRVGIVRGIELALAELRTLEAQMGKPEEAAKPRDVVRRGYEE